jgi:flagellar assembly protein FliH
MSCKIIATNGGPTFRAMEWPTIGAESKAEVIVAPSPDDEPLQSTVSVEQLQGQLDAFEAKSRRDIQAAREAGFRDGEKAGAQRAAADVQPVLDRLARNIADISGLRAKLRREAEGDLVTLAIAIARRVIHRELAVDPDAIQGLVKAALEKVQARDICNIRMHSDYLAQVRPLLQRFNVQVEIAPDSTLKPGDFVIETKRGNLDASIDTQLQEIERGFVDRIRH